VKANSSGPSSTSTFNLPVALPGQIHSYTELQQQIHDDLRAQHPDWVTPNGDCPTCDSYESRLAELIGRFRSAEGKSGAA